MAESKKIIIKNANEHNLKNVSLEIPRNALTVVTGVSGSGKSSLAFDTIFKEGQRRYIASLSAYARQFMQGWDRPNVDLIEGLSPTISIDQKTSGRNPRSTVGTITEIFDFLRLLFSRLGTPSCPNGHGAITNQTPEMIGEHLINHLDGQKVLLMAPMIEDRKGEYRKELIDFREQGFARALVDGKLYRLEEEIKLARYEKHTIELVLDRLTIQTENKTRILESLHKAVELTKGKITLLKADALKDIDEKATRIKHSEKDRFVYTTSNACPTCGYSFPEIEPRLFSFNSPQGACPDCAGLGTTHQFHPPKYVKDSEKSVFDGALHTLNPEGNVLFAGSGQVEISQLFRFYGHDLDTAWGKLPKSFRDRILSGKGKSKDKIKFDITSTLSWLYDKYKIGLFEKYMLIEPCATCDGDRIGEMGRMVFFRGKTIVDFNKMSIVDLHTYFESENFSEYHADIIEPIIKEIRDRLAFLRNVGLDYLSLERRANTLSGGESQRIRLASQIGSGLEGCLYVLDEPSIGLHQSDNKKLIQTLKALRDKSNSVLVIEHDEETMLASDHLVDIGPGAGVQGGSICFSDAPSMLTSADVQKVTTAEYLLGSQVISIPKKRRPPESFIELKNLNRFNLKNLSVKIPIGVMTVLTGVSGSGKSTLMELLSTGVHSKLNRIQLDKHTIESIEGIEEIDKLIWIDQKPIGRTPRSNPATYTKAWDHVRDLFANLPESRVRGYEKGRFSFNTKGGRCEACSGAGVVEVDMQLFSNAAVICEVCEGKRFNRNTLEIHYKGKNIFQILEMPVKEAKSFFENIPQLHGILDIMDRIGLSYITLGQPSTTLSGGEAQRIKLSTELAKKATGNTLYLLDEPTTGLHFSDIQRLLHALNLLVERGNTVIIIEHNMDVIKSADHLIELGPGGGEHGGQLVAEGTPETCAKQKTPTGVELENLFRRQKKREAGDYFKKTHFNQLLKEAKQSGSGFNQTPQKASLKSNTAKKPSSIKHDLVQWITIEGLNKHNLVDVDVRLPKNRIVTVTGVSGSGKTSLAFDTIFQEGQRKYLESLSTYARRFLGRMPRADVKKIEGISPTIAVDQKAGSKNPRSTIATQTEIYDSFRVLFANIGRMHSPQSDEPLQKFSPGELANHLRKTMKDELLIISAPIYTSEFPKRFLLESLEKLHVYLPLLEEKGYLRIIADGEIHRFGEGNGEPEKIAKKIKNAKVIGVIVDRLRCSKKEESRLVEAIEKAYALGESSVWVQKHSSEQVDTDPVFFSGYYSHYNDNVYFEDELTPRHFSFNHHLGACPRCNGLGKALAFDVGAFITNESEPLLKGAINKEVSTFFTRRGQYYGQVLKRACYSRGINIFETPFYEHTQKEKDFLLYGKGNRKEKGKNVWPGFAKVVEKIYSTSSSEKWRARMGEVIQFTTCPECQGGRLNPLLLSVKIQDKSIADICQMNLEKADQFFKSLEKTLPEREKKLVHEVLEEIQFRLKQMLHLGMHYLSLDRTMGTLSGGEVQRIRLSTQIGNKLNDVIYVLDEPTIGLHERDTDQLFEAIQNLKNLGNTVLMVEHDGQVIQRSDWLIDVGPAAGNLGGKIIYSGLNQAKKLSSTSFYPYLYGEKKEQALYRARNEVDVKVDPVICLNNVQQNNIRDLDLAIPLNRFVGLSGVSGSGKSSLLFDWFVPRFSEWQKTLEEHSQLYMEVSGKKEKPRPMNLYLVDQSPVSTSKRSTVSSYMGLFDIVRDVFAVTKQAKERGFEKGHFSFNSPKGRCTQCEGSGAEEIEMHFISDVEVVCDQCKGKRFKEEVLEVKYKGKSVHDVLEMTFHEAYSFFEAYNRIRKKIELLLDTGLGYLKLGINTSKLSGGELQRIKLAKELSKTKSESPNLYLLDEPTTGLHFSDTEKLIQVLDKLVQRGDSVVVIEHNREFLKNCDYIIDMGPEGGDGGGQIVVKGSPAQVKASQKGWTAKYL